MPFFNQREQQPRYCEKVIGGIAPDLKGLTEQCQSIVPPGQPGTILFDPKRLTWRRVPVPIQTDLQTKILNLTKSQPSDDLPDGVA